MKLNFIQACKCLCGGSIITLTLGVATLSLPIPIEPWSSFPTVAIPTSALFFILFGLLTVFFYLKYDDHQGMPYTFGVAIPIVGLIALWSIFVGILYSLDTGSGVNFGFAFAMGGFMPLMLSLLAALVLPLIKRK